MISGIESRPASDDATAHADWLELKALAAGDENSSFHDFVAEVGQFHRSVQRLTNSGVELADVTPREIPQERPQRRRHRHREPQHPARRTDASITAPKPSRAINNPAATNSASAPTTHRRRPPPNRSKLCDTPLTGSASRPGSTTAVTNGHSCRSARHFRAPPPL